MPIARATTTIPITSNRPRSRVASLLDGVDFNAFGSPVVVEEAGEQRPVLTRAHTAPCEPGGGAYSLGNRVASAAGGDGSAHSALLATAAGVANGGGSGSSTPLPAPRGFQITNYFDDSEDAAPGADGRALDDADGRALDAVLEEAFGDKPAASSGRASVALEPR